MIELLYRVLVGSVQLALIGAAHWSVCLAMLRIMQAVRGERRGDWVLLAIPLQALFWWLCVNRFFRPQ